MVFCFRRNSTSSHRDLEEAESAPRKFKVILAARKEND